MTSAQPERIVCWFSAGAASAVATKLTLNARQGEDIRVVRIHVAEEDEDNLRFAEACQEWFGVPVERIESADYATCQEVWTKERYMSGTKGAKCTAEMKRAPRHAFEKLWHPDGQVFGFTKDESKRADQLRASEPWIGLRTPLITAGMSKQDCFTFVKKAGLVLPRMYALGYPNANCVGCVKAQSPNYWNRVRRTHPAVFAARAELSRELGVRLVKLGGGTRPRLFLDELSPDEKTRAREPSWECGVVCPTEPEETVMPEQVEAPAKTPSRKGALSKAAVRALLDRTDLPPAARRALEIRQDAARTSTAKITTLAAAVGPDGRIRDTIEFHAASTGRAGGKMLQPQNLPRDSVKPEDWLETLSVMAHGLPFFRAEMPDASPMGTLVRMLRGSIVPAPGHVFAGGDYAQIEARVVLWFAEERAALELLRIGGKLYETMAGAIYGCRPDDIENPSERRQVGKSAVLGAGFGLGWRKFIEYVFATTGIRISEDLAREAIGAYRSTYPGVPALWRSTEAAAKAAIRAPSSRVAFAGERASFQVTRDSQWMTMTLPSGRRLRYYRPEIRDDTREGWENNEIVSFMGVNQYTRKFQRETTWGGTLVENMIQATARDLLMVARTRVEAHGWPVVLHVHDELLAEIPEDKADGADMLLRELMEDSPAWAKGLPVAAETRTRGRYGK